jgi:hypothetical protein
MTLVGNEPSPGDLMATLDDIVPNQEHGLAVGAAVAGSFAAVDGTGISAVGASANDVRAIVVRPTNSAPSLRGLLVWSWSLLSQPDRITEARWN